MVKARDKKAIIHINKIILSRYLLLILIVCTTLLWIIIFQPAALFTHHDLPVTLAAGNIRRHSATVSFVTVRPTRNCVYLISLWRPKLARSCESQATNLHFMTFDKLPQDTNFQVFLFQGLKWQRYFIDPVGSVLTSPSYVPVPLPGFRTSVKAETETVDLSFFGKITDSLGQTQNGAIVMVSNDDGEIYLARTDRGGKFYLPVPSNPEQDNMLLKVYGESGYKEIPLILPLALDKELKIVVTDYD